MALYNEPTATELAQREALLREMIQRELGAGTPAPAPQASLGMKLQPEPMHEPAGRFSPAAPAPLVGTRSLATVTPEDAKLYAVNFLSGVVDTSFGSFVLGEDEIAKVAFVALQSLDRNLGAVLAALARANGVDKLLNPPAPAEAAPAPSQPAVDPAVMAAALEALKGMGRPGRDEEEDMEEPPSPDPKPTPSQVRRTRTRKS